MRGREKEWLDVGGRKRATRKMKRRVEITFFVANLPDCITVVQLRSAFQAFGIISDAYIAMKKDARGNGFGFIRMVDVQDVERMLEVMNTVKILEAKVVVSLAKYDKFKRPFQPANKQQWRTNETARPQMEFIHQQSRKVDGRSFRDVVSNQQNPGRMGRKTIRFEGDGVAYARHWKKRSVWGVAKDLDSLNYTKAMLEKSGYDDVAISYLGGLSVLVTFKTCKLANDFVLKNVEVWSQKWTSAQIWNGVDVVSGRIVTLRITGVPVLLRDNVTYDRIGASFGQVVGPSEFTWESSDNEVGVCRVVTNNLCKINEEIEVVWENRSFKVGVMEESTRWNPNFPSLDPSPTAVCGEWEVEEGEIREDVMVGGDDGPDVGIPVDNLKGADAELQRSHNHEEREKTLHGNLGVGGSLHAYVVNGEILNNDGGAHSPCPTFNISKNNCEHFISPRHIVDPTSNTAKPILLKKRGRDLRSPPSVGSTQGPTSKQFFEPTPSNVFPDLNSSPAASYPNSNVSASTDEAHQILGLRHPSQVTITHDRDEELQIDGEVVKDTAEQNEDRLVEELQETVRYGDKIGIILSGLEDQVRPVIMDEAANDACK